MEKKILRAQMLQRRKQLSAAVCSRLSRQVQERLVASPLFQRAEGLALYSQIQQEVATALIFKVARTAGKWVAYPKVVGDNLSFIKVGAVDELVPGAFGVAEPVGLSACAVADLDLVVVPGVAFSPDGFRFGYGRGFYDRLLEALPETCKTVGLSFDFQLLDHLPVEKHDQRLDYIVTETRLIPCRV